MKVPTSTISAPSSLQTTQQPPSDSDAQQRILIASFVGVAVILVMILLFAIYCYNKRNPIQSHHAYPDRNSDIATPTHYVYDNKGLQCCDQDVCEFGHDISIKLKIQWDDMYSNTESEKFKTLHDKIVESMEELYKHYCEFRGAMLLKLRKGSVIADIRLKFTKLAVEPLIIIKNAVSQGKCSSLEVEKEYFHLSEQRVRQNRSDKTESGYGSQVFEHISFVEKSQEQKLSASSDNSLKSKKNMQDSSSSSVHQKGDVDNKISKKDMDGWSSSHRVKTKKKNVDNIVDDEGRHHIARFNFQPQDYRELALHQGELVRITCINAGGWVKVINSSGEEGWVPRNFIAEIDPEDYAITKKAVESILILDQVIKSADVLDEVIDETDASIGSVEVQKETSDLTGGSYENIQNDDLYGDESLSGLFVAIFPFDPTDNKELKLEVGDLVDVSRISETGWWKGCCIRTNDAGWFPSTYVKPKSAEINFRSFFGDLSHVEESVSDSELHSSKRSPMLNGYYSDNEENKVQEKYIRCASSIEKSTSFDYDDVEDTRGIKKDQQTAPSEVFESSGSFSDAQPSVHVRITNKCKDNERASSETTEVVDAVLESYIAINPAEPPAKPVPPKPRKQHMRQTYQRLAAKGQLGSTNDPLSRSLESLRVRSKSGSRRFSEEIFSMDGEYNKKMFLRPIEKDRPLSFQGAPRFVQLANRYASNMKASWSLPSLNGDQIKLSPDDDRPYLDPIPRKPKTSSVELLDSKIQSGDVTSDEYVDLTPKYAPERIKSTEAEHLKCEENKISLIVSNENGVYSPKIEETNSKRKVPPPKPERESLKYGISVRLSSNDEPKKPKEIPESLTNYSDEHLPTCSSSEQCDCGSDVKSKESKATDETVKPCTRFRRNSNNRNFTSFERINEEGESTPRKDIGDKPINNVESRTIGPPQEREKINNRVPYCISNDYTISTSHRNEVDGDEKYKNETRYSNIVGNKEYLHTKNKHKIYFRKINSFGEEESEEDSSVSRTSSTLSLSSFNSSNASRSTTSSKHEQMNLRRATMDVCGKGKNELSFKVGAMLYELRPRNKEGLCFGLLEDSTEGWYPSESVEIFQAALQV